MKDFLHDEIEEMLKHKYIESEKAHHDLGNDAITEWVCNYAAIFRKEWIKQHGEVIHGECNNSGKRH